MKQMVSIMSDDEDEKYFDPTRAEICVFCGKAIEPNSDDGEGPIIDDDGDICFIAKILSAFYTDSYILDIDDYEKDSRRDIFHGKCFDDAVVKMKEMTTHISRLEMENAALKRNNERLEKSCSHSYDPADTV